MFQTLQKFTTWLPRKSFGWLRTKPSKKRNGRQRFHLESLEDRRVFAAGFAEFIDPHPALGNGFGASVVPLATGNVVITSPFDDVGGKDAGAVYLFSGRTGKLISTLIGHHDGDHVGSGGVTALKNGNFVVGSPEWHNGEVKSAGAATWGSGIIGVSGSVGPSNSLVGSTDYDQLGAVVALTNGNYVVVSSVWDHGDLDNVGAVTFGVGTTGISGVITTENSLVGTWSNDFVGDVIPLLNGNYVVISSTWHSYSGAVTFGSGTTGISGLVDSNNSLVGTTSFDRVGFGGIFELANGNYVIASPKWGNGEKGAVTFAHGSSGVSGEVSPANSLVGATAGDRVGQYGITELANGNFVIKTPHWNEGSKIDVGAVTFSSGTQGLTGLISIENSLIGGTAYDNVGDGIITALANGNYVVASPMVDIGTTEDVGAVTLCNGAAATSGIVGADNSLVGSNRGDQIGSRGSLGVGVVALRNGNYVISSPNWDDGPIQDAGAVTFANGNSGIRGLVTHTNSLVGSTTGDMVGSGGVAALANGNYVVNSFWWHNGTMPEAGAATWGNGVTGIAGAVNVTNSLIGSSGSDSVGVGVNGSGITPLANGNYVVRSRNNSGSPSERGAATFGNGSEGTVGLITSTNSLVGIDYPGEYPFECITGPSGITALKDGSYLVVAPSWDNGTGAVAFGSGVNGVRGKISELNSLVGSQLCDGVGSGGVTELATGNYVVSSPGWNNGAAKNQVGAVTASRNLVGVLGKVSASNSLVGETALDSIGMGGITALSNGNYVVSSPTSTNGTLASAGALSISSGLSRMRGSISSVNSMVGYASQTDLATEPILDNVNLNVFGRFIGEMGGRVRVGSQIDGFSRPWHLAIQPQDVNNDGHIVAADVLAIINYINAGHSSSVNNDFAIGKPYGFLDVTGDGYVVPEDVIAVINYINAAHPTEGEAPNNPTLAPAASLPTNAPTLNDTLLLLLAADNSSTKKRK